MRPTLYKRLILWVGGPAAVLFAGVLWFSSQRSVQRVVIETEKSARAITRYHAERLNGKLSTAAKIPAMHVRVMESGVIRTPEDLESYLREAVGQSPEIYGSCIVFKPYGFIEGENAYGPYFYRLPDGKLEFVQLGTPEYNYFQWPWYREPRDAGQAIWTEPFFDDGGGDVLMTTRAAPFRHEGSFWGIATIDIALTQLTAETDKIKVGASGYAFLISRSGRFLALPGATDRVMKNTLQESNPGLAKMMMAGEDGFHRTRGPLFGEDAWVAFAPVVDTGFSLALVYPKSEILAEAFSLQREQFVLGVIGLTALFAALVLVARSLSRPITDLAAAAQLVAQGNLDQHLRNDAPMEEVRHLTAAFNKMLRELQMRMQELRYTTTVKERFEGELNAARNIQMSLVPKKFPPFPERTDVEVHALVKPAREVGGDFYDFYLVEEDWLCFFIGDVSGKGVPAALFMAVTKTLLKASSARPGAAAELLAKVNNELCEQTDTGMFVSLLFGLLDLRTGSLELGNAGHPSPSWMRRDGRVSFLDVTRSVALGCMRGLDYPISTIQLTPGDTLFMYTDGVPEALNVSDEFYSPTRLQIALSDLINLPIEKITRGVVQDVRTFSGEREQSDDISVMALRWLGPAPTQVSTPN